MDTHVTRFRDAGLPYLSTEVHLDQLAEAGRVVVTRRLGVAEGLEHGVGVQQDLLHRHLASNKW